jgi:hypothetical protein
MFSLDNTSRKRLSITVPAAFYSDVFAFREKDRINLVLSQGALATVIGDATLAQRPGTDEKINLFFVSTK